jgi:hypothetical protein
MTARGVVIELSADEKTRVRRNGDANIFTLKNKISTSNKNFSWR